MYTQVFTVPEYYTRFSCKCGECRSTCCRGWGISLSMTEYFRLIGLDCSPTLRRRLDTAFHLADDRSPGHYAMVTPRWDGDCPLHGEDGYCMLQRECGEETISAVCRYYPRAPRRLALPGGERFECCTSGSCERTLELLFNDDAPFRTVEAELTFDLELPEPSVMDADAIALRDAAIAVVTDDSLPFEARLLEIGRLCGGAEGGADADGLTLIRRLLGGFEKTSLTLQEYLPAIDGWYDSHTPDGSLTEGLHAIYPRLWHWAGKLFANHLFYKEFGSSPREDFASLCAVWAAAKYMARGWIGAKESPTEADLIDVTAAAFRLIEHSRFDGSASRFVLGHDCGRAFIEL